MNRREPIPYDILADPATSEHLVLDAVASGRPLALYDSSRPDVPPVLFGLNVGHATREP